MSALCKRKNAIWLSFSIITGVLAEYFNRILPLPVRYLVMGARGEMVAPSQNVQRVTSVSWNEYLPRHVEVYSTD